VNGVATATAYALLFTHEQVVHIFGTIACIAYIIDRTRIAYPEKVARFAPWANRLLLRAEEQVREAAMIPYAIAVLLTILTVPKPAALIAIYTLAIADPLAAIVGIRWGRDPLRRIGRSRARSPSSARRWPSRWRCWGRRPTRQAHHRGRRIHDRARGDHLRAPAAAHRRQPDDPPLRRLRDVDRLRVVRRAARRRRGRCRYSDRRLT
jgi:hypothetical protein